MRREIFKGAFLYVEGSSDANLYATFIDQKSCQIIIAHNRFNVVEACRIHETKGFDGVVGIIDADFDHLEQKTPDVSIVFQTDMHDAECFMLSTSAFDKLVSEFASEDKLKDWQAAYVGDLRSHLVQQAAIIGALLWYSNNTCLCLCFGELETKEYVTEPGLQVDVAKMIKHVKNKSQRHDLSEELLAQGLQQQLKISDQVWQIVRSHDLINLLSFALRRTLGSWKSHEVAREHIERGLRLAYAENDFFQTKLHSKIRDWETSHPPFRIFRDLRQQNLAFELQ